MASAQTQQRTEKKGLREATGQLSATSRNPKVTGQTHRPILALQKYSIIYDNLDDKLRNANELALRASTQEDRFHYSE